MAELDLPKAKKRLDALVAAFAVRTFYQRLAFSYRLNVVSCCAGAHAIEKRCIALSLPLVPRPFFPLLFRRPFARYCHDVHGVSYVHHWSIVCLWCAAVLVDSIGLG